MKFLGGASTRHVSSGGLIYFPDLCISEKEVPVICNPITGKYAILPKLSGGTWINFFGFDPIDKQYKVLIMSHKAHGSTVYRILTLGTGYMRWRKIQCPSIHDVFGQGICINGVLYYLAYTIDKTYDDKTNLLVCFDVRSEKFKFVDAEFFRDYSTRLINYKGKLGVHRMQNYFNNFSMWVLEDMEKHEWSTYDYTLSANNDLYTELAGVTATGEIVFSSWKFTCEPFYVVYYNPERNTLRSVEIQGFGAEPEMFYSHCRVYTFVDYIEDLSVNDAKKLCSSIYAPCIWEEQA